MKIPKDELLSVLSQFNPWWRGEVIPDLSTWHRTVFDELLLWVVEPPAPRAIMLSGARQVGKTTLVLQTIQALLDQKVPPGNILYVTFDHPILKLAGIDAVLEAWREREPKTDDAPEFLFLDEFQFISNWGTWIKHQVDFAKQRRIVFTGSATPLVHTEQESGVGRWHTIRIATLSFSEYLQIKQIPAPNIPKLDSLSALFGWTQPAFHRVAEGFQNYIGYFHEYLVRGGFPQTTQVESIAQSQRLLREDIIDKVLKRDMTALFGVRRVIELEHLFIYLCMHEGGLLNMEDLSKNLGIKKPTAQNFINLLEATHLIYRLLPYGYGKEILRAQYKIYLADAAIASAVLLKGKSLLDDPDALGLAVETAVFKHLFTQSYSQNIRFNYWRNSKEKEEEIDIIAETNRQLIPFEVKYKSQQPDPRNLKSLLRLCREHNLSHGYVITKSLSDFGPISIPDSTTRLFALPASLLCYWADQIQRLV